MLDRPITDRRAARREATKAEILEAAWEIVRAEGLAALSLRDLARRVGMQAPSLYQYFDSKNAIYDAMFAGGNQELLARYSQMKRSADPVRDLHAAARTFVEFCAEDPARYQLLFQRTIPGFEPSEDAYAVALQILEMGRARLAAAGFTGPHALDVWTGLVAGLAAQQVANDPGGKRWTRLVDEVVDMYVGHMRKRRGT